MAADVSVSERPNNLGTITSCLTHGIVVMIYEAMITSSICTWIFTINKIAENNEIIWWMKAIEQS